MDLGLQMKHVMDHSGRECMNVVVIMQYHPRMLAFALPIPSMGSEKGEPVGLRESSHWTSRVKLRGKLSLFVYFRKSLRYSCHNSKEAGLGSISMRYTLHARRVISYCTSLKEIEKFCDQLDSQHGARCSINEIAAISVVLETKKAAIPLRGQTH